LTFKTANGALINDGGKVAFNGPVALNGRMFVSQGPGDLELAGTIGATGTAGSPSLITTGDDDAVGQRDVRDGDDHLRHARGQPGGRGELHGDDDHTGTPGRRAVRASCSARPARVA
jgi:hypothetical protein